MVSLRTKKKLPRSFELNANITNNKRKDEIGLGSPTCCSRKGYDPDRSQTCHVNSCDTFGLLPTLHGFQPSASALWPQWSLSGSPQSCKKACARMCSSKRKLSRAQSWLWWVRPQGLGHLGSISRNLPEAYENLQYQYKDLWYAMV